MRSSAHTSLHSRLDAIKDWKSRARVARYRVSALADGAKVSRQQLRRYFLARAKITPKRWLDWLEIEDAIPRLQNGDRIKDMSSDLGAADPSHFARSFRRITGIAPSNSRAQKFVEFRTKFQNGRKGSRTARKVPKWPT
jgi:AraC-like DNA-binding protein